MPIRIFTVAILALTMLAGATALAAEDAKSNTHDGKLVSVTGKKLVMTDKEGKEHSHTLTDNAKITSDGKVCKVQDLKAGTQIRVTTKTNDATAATRIEAIVSNAMFANTHVGKFVSIKGDKLVMTGLQDKNEQSCTLTDDVRVTCDGKVCKAQDLKAGTQIRITTQTNDARIATSIEAIDKNKSFSSTHDGNVVSIKGNKLVMTGLQGKAEQSCTLTDDVKVTCDGKVCKSMDLKPGMKVRVTSASDEEPNKVIRIEAIDKDLKFASL